MTIPVKSSHPQDEVEVLETKLRQQLLRSNAGHIHNNSYYWTYHEKRNNIIEYFHSPYMLVRRMCGLFQGVVEMGRFYLVDTVEYLINLQWRRKSLSRE